MERTRWRPLHWMTWDLESMPLPAYSIHTLHCGSCHRISIHKWWHECSDTVRDQDRHRSLVHVDYEPHMGCAASIGMSIPRASQRKHRRVVLFKATSDHHLPILLDVTWWSQFGGSWSSPSGNQGENLNCFKLGASHRDLHLVTGNSMETLNTNKQNVIRILLKMEN